MIFVFLKWLIIFFVNVCGVNIFGGILLKFFVKLMDWLILIFLWIKFNLINDLLIRFKFVLNGVFLFDL